MKNNDKIYVGIDIGGTYTKAGAVQNGELINKTRIPTQSGHKEGFFKTVNTAIDEVMSKYPNINGIGLGIAGMVLADKGTVLGATNLGLDKINIVDELQKKYQLPIKIANDVSCFALAEYSLAQNTEDTTTKTQLDDLVYLAIGTGINVGIINKGQLFSGTDGASIEFGHASFNSYTAPLCTCGLTGCLECYLSGKAIMQASENWNLNIKKPEEMFALDNDHAKAVANTFMLQLKAALLSICNLYRPQKIFIGGGLASVIAPHIDNLNQHLKNHNYGYKNAPEVKTEISQISTDGGVIGAALLFNNF